MSNLDGLRPTDLGSRGQAFLEAMNAETEDNPSRLVLLVEAARLLDTLDRYNKIINGEVDDFLEIEMDGGLVVIKVDKIVTERRLTAGTLRQVLNGIASVEPSGRVPVAEPEPQVDRPGDKLAELRQRAERRWGGAS